MKQINLIFLVCLFACLGCQSTQPTPPLWEQTKFNELAPAKHSTQTDKNRESLLQFNVYVLSVPAGNFADVKAIWTSLSTKPIHFNSANLFSENGFAAGFGQTSAWQPNSTKLQAAGSKIQKTVELIMPDNSTDRASLLKIDAEKNIFYKSQDNQVGGVTLGPGEAMLRFTAAAIPDMRGVCNLTIEPIFHSFVKPDSLSAGTDELVFNAVSLTSKMSPGDLILLGPVNYGPQDMTLSGIFFSSPGQSAVQLYLIVCAGVDN